jgi:hypothetical protein
MDEADMRTMLRGLADTMDGSARIDLPLAARQGLRSRQRRRMRIGGSVLAMGAAIGVFAAVLVLPGARAAGVAPAVPASAPASAPTGFSPLVPYAAFSWLPAGWHVGQKSPTFQNDLMATSTPALLFLPVWAPAGGGDLMVFPAGQCKSTAATLLCNWQNTPWRKAGAAPDVSGRRAYWLTEAGSAPGSLTIAWQYAPGGWAMLGLSNATPAGSSRALVLSLAAAVRFGRTTPVLFPYQFRGMVGWQVSEVDYTMVAGQPVARMLHLANGRLRKQVQLDVSPPGTVDQPCGQQGTVAGTATLDGSRLEILRRGWQVCGDDVDGLQVNLFLEDSTNGLPTIPSGSGGALAYARKLRLLGTSQANWTANPLR